MPPFTIWSRSGSAALKSKPCRREFLQTLAAAAVAAGGRPPPAGAMPAVAPAAVPQSKRLKNFVWLRPSITKTADDWRRDFGVMRASGIHAIVPEIYNGRQTLFQS